MNFERTNESESLPKKNAANFEAAGLFVKADRRFARASYLRYMIFVYNATQPKTETVQPDVTIQTQILRGGEILITSLPRPIYAETSDSSQLSYAAEISLETLTRGRYELLVLVRDRLAKTDIAQRSSFEIE